MRKRIRSASVFAAIIAVFLGIALPLTAVFAAKKSHMAFSILPDAAAPDAGNSEAARLNSIGVAYMNQQRFGDAQKQFDGALKAQADYALAKLNLGVSLLSQQKSEDAKKALLEASEKLPRDPYAWYNLGLVYKDVGDQEKAIAAFQRVTEIAPSEPDAFYFIGYLNTQLQNYVAQTLAAAASSGACFFDYDGDGKPDLLFVSANETGALQLLHNAGGGKFEDKTSGSGIALTGSGLGCAAGDFDNDGKTDFAVCMSDGVHLFHNDGAGKFTDVTKTVGIKPEKGCVGLTFVDYDHDGDLDLYVTAKPGGDAHNVMWRNNGNSTFTDVSAETALGTEATGAGVVTSDFNNDRAIDFVLAGGAKGASILLNPREGQFKALAGIDFAKEGS